MKPNILPEVSALCKFTVDSMRLKNDNRTLQGGGLKVYRKLYSHSGRLRARVMSASSKFVFISVSVSASTPGSAVLQALPEQWVKLFI